VTVLVKLAGEGTVSATATLVANATKVGAKPKTIANPILLGSGQAVATHSGTLSILIQSRAGALAIYRKHPSGYRISVALRSTSGAKTPVLKTVWLSVRASRIIAAGGHGRVATVRGHA